MIESDEINIKIPIRESARYWFKRPAYAAFELKRGDANGRSSIDRERTEKSVPAKV